MSRYNPSICLCMIVKNEAAVIARALASVRGIIDYWVICDTGSTDETMALIQSSLKGIPGELHEVSWRNFSSNREEVLRLARKHGDYLLIMDADMEAVIKAPFKHQLKFDFYEIRYTGEIDYTQPMLLSSRHEWKYKGVTHEYLFSAGAQTWDFLPQLELEHHADGGSRSDKFERDIQLLGKGLEEEPDNERYMFYLAQSYNHTGNWTNALHWYEQRVKQRGWDEERWYALYQSAIMKEKAGYPWEQVQSTFLAAFAMRPARMEPVYRITQHHIHTGDYSQGYLFSAIALQGLNYPVTDRLFIEKPVYDYLLLLDHVTCALANGRLSETIKGANMILKQTALPENVFQQATQLRKQACMLLYQQRESNNAGGGKIIVIVPFYNAGDHLDRCAESLVIQDYSDFEVIFIDDASTDGQQEFIPPVSLNAVVIHNQKRRGAAYNLKHAIIACCDPDDIVVCLDGDDQLANPQVLQTIYGQYKATGCWIMYGQYEAADGKKGISAPYASPDDFSTLRNNWRSSHIKTFKAGLFMKIAEQDPEYSCLKADDGKWLTAAVDAAIMFPLLEMAGFWKVVFNSDVLYLYNNAKAATNEEALYKHSQQINFENIKQRRPFARVQEYFPVDLKKELV